MESNSISLLLECPKCSQKTTDWEEGDYGGIIEYYLNKIRQTEEMRLRELSYISQNIAEFRDRIFGNSVGYVQETVTLLDLKRSFPFDSFSDEMASKHGTDIISEVVENGMTCGKISISVKHHQKWSSEFLEQLENNIENDGSDAGILVTTSFPGEALNKRIWTTRDSRGMLVLLIKPEYAPIAYYAVRQIVIQLKSVQKYLDARVRNNGK